MMISFFRYILFCLCVFLSTFTATADNKNHVSIGIILPLHQADGDGKRMTEYYRGMLMAFDQLKSEGYSIDVHAWNVNADADIRTTLLDEHTAKCDIIFGPLYSKQVKPLADFCQSKNIRLVIPFSISDTDIASNKSIFQVYQDDTRLLNATLNAFLERFSKCHPVFVDCNDASSRKGVFTMALRRLLEAKGIAYNVTNLKSDDEAFAKAFTKEKTNVVILNTARSPELNEAFTKLERFDQLRPGTPISMFGYTEWLMYAPYDFNHFCKYDTYIPTTFYYNASSTATTALERSYRSWFHEPMQQALPRFAITGYDHAQFFVRGYAKYGRKFLGSKWQQVYKFLQSPLKFEPVEKDGRINSSFQLIHYLYNGNIESIAY